MPASQEQKVDFLLKKIGYSASKTGVAEDESTIGLSTNTAKKPFEEGIASPLTIPSTSILSDSSFIPTTPPGSDTLYVKGYRTATALRMTRDSTVGTNTRSYIAYTTYNDTSSARLTNWIDTQFGSSYIIKVYKGDPNSGGVELQQAGGNAGTDGWFFDYSSGILNFNGINLPDGVTATNIYIVGYRYIGATGVQPPAGIGTFHDLVVHNNFSVAGLSTFNDDVRFVGAAGTILFDKSDNALEFSDSVRAKFGADTDMEIYHTTAGGGTNFIKGTGNLTLQSNVIVLEGQSGDDAVRIDAAGGAVKIYHPGSGEKLRTTSTGAQVTGLTDTDTLLVSGISTFVGIITASAVGNVIPFLFNNYSDLPSASSYHGAFAHVHEYGKGYFAHAGNWYELVNKETTGIVGTGTERYDIGYLDATNLYVSGITTLGSIGISTGLISGPAITYIDPATVGDNTGTLVVKGNLQVDGTQTTVNSSTMNVADKNVGIASGAANDAAADGAGLTVYSGDGNKTWNWVDATDSWTSSEHIRIPDNKVFGFASDTNTFISRPSADTIAFTTGGDQRVSINSNGNVIIGTTSWNFEKVLNVQGSSGNIISLYNGDTTTYAADTFAGIELKLRTGNTGTQRASCEIRAFKENGTNGDSARALSFYTGVNGGSPTEKLRITAAGQVGIGSASPTAKLDVIGDTKLQGNLDVAGVSTFSDDVRIIDDKKLMVGNSGSDLYLKHISSSNYSQIAAAPALYIQSNDLKFKDFTNGDDYINAVRDGSVDLYYNNTKRFSTSGIGATVFGQLDTTDIKATGITTTGTLNVGITGHTMVGITTILDEDDMASNSATALVTQQSLVAYVGNSAPGGSALSVSADSGSNETINLSSEVLDIEGTANEIETSTGTNKVVIGLPDNVSIGGTITVGTGATIDSNGQAVFAGITTFNDNVILAEQKELRLEPSGAFKLYRGAGGGGANNFIKSTFGSINVEAANSFIAKVNNTHDAIAAYANDRVDLYYANNIKLTTKSSGVGIAGSVTVSNDLSVTGITTTGTLNTGDTTFTGTISAGSTTGTDGYYLKSVGTGVTWAAFPSSRTGLTTTATAGQTSFNFSYNVGFVDVFVNGVKLPTSEFTANNGSTIVLDDAAFANDTLEFISLNTLPVTSSGGASNLNGLADVTITGSPVVGETLQHNGSEFVNDYTVTATTTSTSQTAILSLPVATYRSAEYTIQVTEGTKYHVTKVLAIHDGTNVTFNEYGTLTTSTSLSTFALDVSSGNMRLLATPASTNSTAFKVKFTAIKV